MPKAWVRPHFPLPPSLPQIGEQGASRLVIEVDGGIHLGQLEADANRSRELEAKCYQVVRFPNDQVEGELETVLSVIQATCQPETPRPRAGEEQG